MKGFKNYLLPVLILISALSVSASAAFYSVYGLSKLFAGATLAVVIMASTLEASKLVIATLLHTYWTRLNTLLKYYLTSAVILLVVITSMGIYGFLSSAYQTTFNEYQKIENQIDFLKQKESFYQSEVDRYSNELETTLNNINNLSQARAVNIQVRDTSVVGGVRNTISTSELRLAQQRLEIEEDNRRELQSNRSAVSDSLQQYQSQILELENNNEIASELGPLEYISGLTGIPMDRVVKEHPLYSPTPSFSFNDSRMDIIGQNGNTGEHYEEDLWSTGEYWDLEPYSTQSITQQETQNLNVRDNRDEEDWKIVDDEPIEEDPDEDTKPEVVKVLQKTPTKRHILLDNGKRVTVNKEDFDDKSNTIKYL